MRILWTNGVWTISEVSKSKLMIDNSESENLDYVVDYPIRYDNGNVAYDNPITIPKYVREKVEEVFKFLNDEKQKGYLQYKIDNIVFNREYISKVEELDAVALYMKFRNFTYGINKKIAEKVELTFKDIIVYEEVF